MASNFQYNYASMALFRVKVDKTISTRLENAGAYAENAIKMALSMPGTGHMYGSHRASAPGMPPTVLTGALRASIAHKVIKMGLFFSTVVGTNLWYAPLLEFGTSRMAPRPFIRATLAKIQAMLWRIMAGGKVD